MYLVNTSIFTLVLVVVVGIHTTIGKAPQLMTFKHVWLAIKINYESIRQNFEHLCLDSTKLAVYKLD